MYTQPESTQGDFTFSLEDLAQHRQIRSELSEVIDSVAGAVEKYVTGESTI